MAKSEFCTMGMSTNHLGLSLNSFGTEFSGNKKPKKKKKPTNQPTNQPKTKTWTKNIDFF